MRMLTQAARLAAAALIAAGLASLLAAGLIAVHKFEVKAPNGRRYGCGSALFAKDPRNRANKYKQVPRPLRVAYTRCQKTRVSRTHSATNYMIAGAIPLLFVLALPSLSRGSRRVRRRLRF